MFAFISPLGKISIRQYQRNWYADCSESLELRPIKRKLLLRKKHPKPPYENYISDLSFALGSDIDFILVYVSGDY